MKFDDLYTFWHPKERKVYEPNMLAAFHLKQEDEFLLSEIGLPIIQGNYHSFFPYTVLERINIRSTQYLKLGSPFSATNRRNDNLIVLDPKTSRVYFYSEPFFQIGFVPDALTVVNNSLLNFLFFQTWFSLKI